MYSIGHCLEFTRVPQSLREKPYAELSHWGVDNVLTFTHLITMISNHNDEQLYLDLIHFHQMPATGIVPQCQAWCQLTNAFLTTKLKEVCS